MTETIVESHTGGRKGKKPEQYSLIPTRPLAELARQYAHGAEKYDAHNWRRGYDFSLAYDALQRHATLFWQGEDVDEDGRPHMAAVAFHAFTLLEFLSDEGYAEFDDRPTKPSPAIESVIETMADIKADWISDLHNAMKNNPRPVPVVRKNERGGYLYGSGENVD